MVPERGLEPPRPCDHCDLNAARLPVPPLGHECEEVSPDIGGLTSTTKPFHSARRSVLCQRDERAFAAKWRRPEGHLHLPAFLDFGRRKAAHLVLHCSQPTPLCSINFYYSQH